jgi:ATP-dependent 26S proteasome regulatory subunit
LPAAAGLLPGLGKLAAKMQLRQDKKKEKKEEEQRKAEEKKKDKEAKKSPEVKSNSPNIKNGKNSAAVPGTFTELIDDYSNL